MPSKMAYFAILALLAAFAIGLPTDNKHALGGLEHKKDFGSIRIHTDDVDMLNNISLLPFHKLLNTEESRNLSYDGTGLKLRGLHFHESSLERRLDFCGRPPSEAPLSSRREIESRDAIEARDGPLAVCRPRCFNANEKPTAWTWNNPNEPKTIKFGACTWIADHLHNVNGDHVVQYYENAKCMKDRTCAVTLGVHLWNKGSSPANTNALILHCEAALNQIIDKCGKYGGSTDCKISHDGGKSTGGNGDGYWSFFMQMREPCIDPCKLNDDKYACIDKHCENRDIDCGL